VHPLYSINNATALVERHRLLSLSLSFTFSFLLLKARQISRAIGTRRQVESRMYIRTQIARSVRSHVERERERERLYKFAVRYLVGMHGLPIAGNTSQRRLASTGFARIRESSKPLREHFAPLLRRRRCHDCILVRGAGKSQGEGPSFFSQRNFHA
jgi:hypothetical protein